MIDTATGKERNLKNIKQIGTPSEEDKIYIENAAYQRVHAEEYASRRVFVFMGHTECDQGRYTTFIEAAIPVRNIDFSQNVPKWDNHAWSDIFQEIKRSYEDSIIVGWALDIKGFVPRMSLELEEVHREHFGGAHQMLLLMDSLEGEEYFYINKGNRLQRRDGFYIYYCQKPKGQNADVTVEFPQASRRRGTRRQEMSYAQQRQEELPRHPEPRKSGQEESGPVQEGARYRAVKQEAPRSGHRASSYAMTAAILLLIGIVGVGAYQDRINLPGLKDVIATMSDGLKSGQEQNAEVLVGTELKEQAGGTQSTETDADALDLVPVEELPSGEIKQTDDTQKPTGEAEQQEESGGKDDAAADGQEKADEAKETDGKAKDKENGGEDASEAAAEPDEYYIVQKGDSLTAICREIYGSSEYIEKIVEKNHLEDADDIRVGQKLLLP